MQSISAADLWLSIEFYASPEVIKTIIEMSDLMEIKRFQTRNGLWTYYCYTKCPPEAGIEFQTIIDSHLSDLNDFFDSAYNAYKTFNPTLFRPTIYVYICEEKIDDINAFTDGKDIYLSVGITVAMMRYIQDHIEGTDIFERNSLPQFLNEGAAITAYKYIMRLVVAHELMHIWHGHRAWKRNCLRLTEPLSNLDNDIFEEMVTDICMLQDESDWAGLSSFVKLKNGKIDINSIKELNFIQQILEIDADVCAINIVLQSLNAEMADLVRKDTDGGKANARAQTHRVFIAMIASSAALMCGYFDSRYSRDPFETLKLLLKGNHPLPSIRFYKMMLTAENTIYALFPDKEFADWMLEIARHFSFDLFIDEKAGSLKDCFWATVHTGDAQEYIAELDKGWNAIYDSLKNYSLMKLPPKYSNEGLIIMPEDIWFDSNGEPLFVTK